MDCKYLGWCNLTPDAQAEWAGAIGTILAVCVAILAPIWHSKRLAFLQERQQVRALAGMVSYAQDVADRFVAEVTNIVNGADRANMAHAVNQVCISLESVNAHALPDDRLVYPLLSMRENARIVHGWLKGGFGADEAEEAAKAFGPDADAIISVHQELEANWFSRKAAERKRRAEQRKAQAKRH